VPTRAETDRRPTRANLRARPASTFKPLPRVYLFSFAGHVGGAPDLPDGPAGARAESLQDGPFAQHLRPNRPSSTQRRRFPLDIRKENAIACSTTFIPNTNATVRRSVQQAPGDVRDTRGTAVGEEMQLAVHGVRETSTSASSVGTEPGAHASLELSHNPYGLCTPRRVFPSRATRHQAAFRVSQSAVPAHLATPEPAPTHTLHPRAPFTAPAGAPA
jgi:hypothetical protein